MPLFILPLCSLLYTAQFACTADTLILLVCAAIAEELLFRGWFLFRLSPRPAAAVCGSSLVFALLHAANLVHHADWRFALLQILCAFFFGLSCGVLTIACQSLYPALFIHVLVNLTGASASLPVHILVICMTLYAFYSIALFKHTVHKEKQL